MTFSSSPILDSWVLYCHNSLLIDKKRLKHLQEDFKYYGKKNIPSLFSAFEKDLFQYHDDEDDESKRQDVSDDKRRKMNIKENIGSIGDIPGGGFVSKENVESIEQAEDKGMSCFFYKQLNEISDCTDVMKQYLQGLEKYSSQKANYINRSQSKSSLYFKDACMKEIKRRRKVYQKRAIPKDEYLEEVVGNEAAKCEKPLGNKVEQQLHKRNIEQDIYNRHRRIQWEDLNCNNIYDFNSIYLNISLSPGRVLEEHETARREFLNEVKHYHLEENRLCGKTLLHVVLFHLLLEIRKNQDLERDKLKNSKKKSQRVELLGRGKEIKETYLKAHLESEYNLIFFMLNMLRLQSICMYIHPSPRFGALRRMLKQGGLRKPSDFWISLKRCKDGNLSQNEEQISIFEQEDRFSPGIDKMKSKTRKSLYKNSKLNNLLSKYNINDSSSSDLHHNIYDGDNSLCDRHKVEVTKYPQTDISSYCRPNNSISQNKIGVIFARKRYQIRLFLVQLSLNHIILVWNRLRIAIDNLVYKLKSERLERAINFLQFSRESNEVLDVFTKITTCKLKTLLQSFSGFHMKKKAKDMISVNLPFHKENEDSCGFHKVVYQENIDNSSRITRIGRKRKLNKDTENEKTVKNQIRILSLFAKTVYNDTFNGSYSYLFRQIYSPLYPQACISQWHKNLDLFKFHIQFTIHWSIQMEIMVSAKKSSQSNSIGMETSENRLLDKDNSRKLEIKLFQEYLQFILFVDETHANLNLENKDAESQEQDNLPKCRDPGNLWLAFKCSFADAINQQKYLRSPFLHNFLTNSILENYALCEIRNIERPSNFNAEGDHNLEASNIRTVVNSLNSIRSLIFLWNINELILIAYFRLEEDRGLTSTSSSSLGSAEGIRNNTFSSLPRLVDFNPIEVLPFLEKPLETFLKLLAQKRAMCYSSFTKAKSITSVLSDILDKVNINYFNVHNSIVWKSSSAIANEKTNVHMKSDLKRKIFQRSGKHTERGSMHSIELLLMTEWIKQYGFIVYDIISGIILSMQSSSFTRRNGKVVHADLIYQRKMLNVFLFLTEAIFFQDKGEVYGPTRQLEYSSSKNEFLSRYASSYLSRSGLEAARRTVKEALEYFCQHNAKNQQSFIYFGKTAFVVSNSDLLCQALHFCPLLFPIMTVCFYNKIQGKGQFEEITEEKIFSILQKIKCLLKSIRMDDVCWWFALFDYFDSSKDHKQSLKSIEKKIFHSQSESKFLKLCRHMQLKVLEKFLQGKREETSVDNALPLVEMYIQKCKLLLAK